MTKFSAIVQVLTVICCLADASQAEERELNKSSANLTSIKIRELEEHNNWQIIDLSHNSIEFIDSPELLQKQSALEAFQLDYNVKSFGAIGNEKIFENKFLKRMSCRGCGFVEIQAQNFAGFDSLSALILPANRIKRIDVDAFKRNFYLRELDLSGNELQVLPVATFAGLKSFETLRLSSNEIKVPISKPFLSSDSLKTLVMSDCNLTVIYPQTFAETRNLRELILNSNRIESLPVGAFKLNGRLKSLLFESNRLKFFPASILDDLRELEELCVDNNLYVNSNEFVKFLSKYKSKRLRTATCNSDVDTMIEYLFKEDDDAATVDLTPETNSTEQKFAQLKFHEGISDFFIGSYLTVILIVQAIAFVLLTLYLIKITKYEKLGSGTDVNYANTILNDNDIYKVFKLNE